MSSCPLPGEEWNNLVSILGLANAHTAFRNNNYEIPTLERAREILAQIKVQDLDEQDSSISDQKKRERSIEQMTMLDLAEINSKYKGQKATIQKLKQMVANYTKFLNENIDNATNGRPFEKTRSVSVFAGVSDFKGNREKYKSYEHFGIFLHEVLEKLQKRAIMERKPAKNIISQDYFNSLYKEYMKQNPFEIQNLTKEEMYRMAFEMINKIDSGLDISECVILPEITIVGESKDGDKLVGRVDMMVIDSMGRIHIYDFKTKKIDNMLTEGSMDIQKAMLRLAMKSYNQSISKAGIGETFREILNRTTYDSWMLQLGIYQNILKQYGLDVRNSTVAALMYQTDQDNAFIGSVMKIFDNETYYDITRNIELNIDGQWFQDESSVSEHVKRINRAINIEVPVAGQTVEDDTNKNVKPEDTYEFTPTQKNILDFVEKLKSIVEGQIKTVNSELKDAKKDPVRRDEDLISLLETRKSSLENFQDIIAKLDIKDNDINKVLDAKEGLMHSVNFFNAIDTMEASLKSMEEISKKALAKYENAKGNETDIRESLTESQKAFNDSVVFEDLIRTMEDIVNEAAQKPENKITPDSRVRKKLSQLNAMSQVIQANFKEIAMANAVMVGQSLGEVTFKRVNDQIKNAITPRLEKLYKDREQLENNPKLGLFKELKIKSLMWLNKDYKDKMKNLIGLEGDILLAQKEKIEIEIKRYEYLLKGYDISEESIKKLINGATNPASFFYPGMQNPFQIDPLLSGWKLDTWMASASNSDVLIASFTTMLKDAKSQGEQRVFADLSVKNFVNMMEDMKSKGYPLEEIDSMLSEYKDILIYDYEKKQTDRKRIFSVITPYSTEYRNKFKELQYAMSDAVIKVKEIRRKLLTDKNLTAVEKEQLTKEFEESSKDRDDKMNQYYNWVVENCNMPYVDDFYKLQTYLPQDIREKMQKIYFEQDVIFFNSETAGGKNEAVMLDEDDFKRLKELEIELKKLKSEAAEQSEDYKKYIEKFEQYFEIQTNDKFYKQMEDRAKVRYSDSPELLEKWYEENSVTRPKSEWYKELQDLYKKREEIYEKDEELSEIFKRKNKIISAHKNSGRFNPRYLTDEEIKELDNIEAEIEELIEQKKAQGYDMDLTDEELDTLRQISNRIQQLTVNTINPIYTKDFKNKTNILKQAYANFLSAESKYITAKAKGVQKDIDDAREQVDITGNRFKTAEQEYEKWYNRNHYDSYTSIRINENLIASKIPKKFNYERLPAPSIAKKYMETVPNPQYFRIKRPRQDAWLLDGVRMSQSEINKIKEDVKFSAEASDELAKLKKSGRLVIQQGALNPDYYQGHDGIPLPKELTVVKEDTKTRFVLKNPSLASGNINAKYLEILNNKDRFQLYNAFTDMYFGLQKSLEGRNIGYLVPGFAGSLVENYYAEGLGKAVKKGISSFIDRNLKKESQQDMVENVYGDLGSKVRMRFSKQLDENIQSKSAVNSVLKWVTEAHMAIAMQEIAPKAKAFVQLMKIKREELVKQKLRGDQFVIDEVTGKKIKVDLEKRIEDLDNFIKIIEFENNKFLYGIKETETNRTAKKWVDGLFKWTSFIRIGFDLANQTKNLVSGNVQAYLAANSFESNHYSSEDLLFAKGQFYGTFLSNYFKDYGRLNNLSQSTLLYRMINPVQKDMMKYFDNAVAGRGRKAMTKIANVGELMYLLQDKGDTEIGITVMYAVMNNYKYRIVKQIDPATGEKIYEQENGKDKLIPAHECYEVDKLGNLVIRNDVEYTKADEKFLRNIIYSEVRRAQGNYADADQTEFESKLIGKIVFFFRKFVVPQFLNRFGYMRPNWEGAEVAMGYWRAVAACIKNYGVGQTAKQFLVGSPMLGKLASKVINSTIDVYTVTDPVTGEKKQVKGDFYSKRLEHARKDAVTMILLTVLSSMLLSYVRRKDDDDEEIDLLTGNLIRILWGVKGETISMFPIGQGSNEYLKNFTTAVPFLREATAAKNLFNHAWKTGMLMSVYGGTDEPDFEGDDTFHQELWQDSFYSRKTGAYEKGDSKLVKDFVDLTGIRNFRDLVNPQNRLDVLERTQ